MLERTKCINSNLKVKGRITWFSEFDEKNIRWYSLVAFLKNILSFNQRQKANIIIKGFYGSKLTDLTDYNKLKCNLGCIKVIYNDVIINLWNAIKMIKQQKGAFQFVILSFIGVVDMERKLKYFESFGKFSKDDLKNSHYNNYLIFGIIGI